MAAAQKKREHKHGEYLAMTLWTVASFDRDCETVLASCRNVLGWYEEMGGRSAEGTVAFHLLHLFLNEGICWQGWKCVAF